MENNTTPDITGKRKKLKERWAGLSFKTKTFIISGTIVGCSLSAWFFYFLYDINGIVIYNILSKIFEIWGYILFIPFFIFSIEWEKERKKSVKDYIKEMEEEENK